LPKEEKIKRTRQEVEKIKRGINQSHSSESHSPPQYRIVIMESFAEYSVKMSDPFPHLYKTQLHQTHFADA
jgi:hypothetical protein